MKGELIYELKNGEGFVKEYDDNKLLFEGKYINGEKNGKGKEYDKNGKLQFEGEYLNGKKWSGNGYDINNNIVYNLKDGKGLIKFYNSFGNIKFEGEYLDGDINGKGKEYNNYSKLIYEGEYLNGKKWKRKRIL